MLPRYSNDDIASRYNIGDVVKYCQRICKGKALDAKIIQGAEEVLNTRVLVRPSSEANIVASDLLRPAVSTPEPNAIEELVRATAAPSEPQNLPRKSRFACLLGRKQ